MILWNLLKSPFVAYREISDLHKLNEDYNEYQRKLNRQGELAIKNVVENESDSALDS